MRKENDKEYRSADELFRSYIRGYKPEVNGVPSTQMRNNALRQLREKIEDRFEEVVKQSQE